MSKNQPDEQTELFRKIAVSMMLDAIPDEKKRSITLAMKDKSLDAFAGNLSNFIFSDAVNASNISNQDNYLAITEGLLSKHHRAIDEGLMENAAKMQETVNSYVSSLRNKVKDYVNQQSEQYAQTFEKKVGEYSEYAKNFTDAKQRKSFVRNKAAKTFKYGGAFAALAVAHGVATSIAENNRGSKLVAYDKDKYKTLPTESFEMIKQAQFELNNEIKKNMSEVLSETIKKVTEHSKELNYKTFAPKESDEFELKEKLSEIVDAVSQSGGTSKTLKYATNVPTVGKKLTQDVFNFISQESKLTTDMIIKNREANAAAKKVNKIGR